MERLYSIVKSDLAKVRINTDWKSLIGALICNSSFKRITAWRLRRNASSRLAKVLWGGANRMLSTRYSVYISTDAEIGRGFCLSHCFSIVISKCKIGDNVTVLQQVTIGSERGGENHGFPEIGNNVFIACGAKVIGKVKVGNNVVIGANALVIRDVPDNAVVGGVPARILNYDGPKHVRHWCKDMKDYVNGLDL